MQHKGIDTDYACPDWYVHIQAARYLKVPPWELVKQSVYWRDKALAAMSAEHEANEIINSHPK